MPRYRTQDEKLARKGFVPGTVIWRHGTRHTIQPDRSLGPSEVIIKWRGKKYKTERGSFRAMEKVYGPAHTFGIGSHDIQMGLVAGEYLTFDMDVFWLAVGWTAVSTISDNPRAKAE